MTNGDKQKSKTTSQLKGLQKKQLMAVFANCGKKSTIAFYFQGSVHVFKYSPSSGGATLRQQWEDLQERIGSEE